MMNISIKNILISSLVVLFSSPVFAGPASDQIEKKFGGKILKKEESTFSGLTAILAEKSGKKRIFYESKDGKFLFYGTIYDENGNELSNIDLAKMVGGFKVGKVNEAPGNLGTTGDLADAGYAAAARSSGVSTGSGEEVFIVFDPNCPYCKRLYKYTKEMTLAKKVTWIPVGVLQSPGGSSHKKAATFIANGSNSLKLDDLSMLEEGNPSASDMEKASKNVKVMFDSQSDQIPVIFFKESGKSSMIRGLPSKEVIESILTKKSN